MSDTLKPPKGPPPPETPPEKRPIENPKVTVTVKPKERSDREYADKVKRNLEGEVRETLKKHAGDGHQKQLDQAADTAKKAGTLVDPRKVKEISVDVSGKIGKEQVSKETTVKPAPPPPPPEKKPEEKK